MGIRQQYGLTESGAAITSTDDYEAKAGSCGTILPTGQLKLRSVKDMGYSIDRLEGEVMLQGPQMFKGYYYNKEETDNSIDEDGWFHSGDIARIDPKTGRVSIIDRVKISSRCNKENMSLLRKLKTDIYRPIHKSPNCTFMVTHYKLTWWALLVLNMKRG